MRSAAIVLWIALSSSCATAGQQNLLDFNSAFRADIPTSPKFKIEPVGGARFQIVVYQGKPLLSERTTRAAFLTQAALIAMEGHCVQLNSTLGEHSFQDRVDSWGYVNVLGFFVCKVRV